MSNHIYPECPECGEKAGENNGVSLLKLQNQPFWWICFNCKRKYLGTWKPSWTDVRWIDSEKIGLLDQIRIWVLDK